ncbi:hypothetical protein LZP85_08125 [Priestia flexa]|uniref:Uncharacterized protein n=1 Tax=Priestia flexa TaxID=86664 RepID=A0A8I1MEH3_9BACI|nr:hypothetical protein [Priestia flexa]MBN8251366.1 hypothetical protein [Priestia flexa]MBN8434371.1 hypothetical protein [Priestia flexa]MCA0966845.1 hypothetical protein [Priestia flexa]RIV09465.1 hypothetical protein D1859_11865 [Priestia flexa]UIR31734.1 hypothetical protein LZP85_08125 [Priestia flexa]
MKVVNELYQTAIFEINREKLIDQLTKLKESHEEQIVVIKEKIEKYEQKKRAQETWYQSLSPFRKIFTGRPLSHHEAVEYMVHVKDRFRKIEQFKGKIREVERVLELLTQEVVIEEIVLTSAIVEGLSRMEER